MLPQVDGTTDVPVEARVEELLRILQRSALGERQLHHVVVGLAGAHYSVVRPDRSAHPLPFLDDVRIGFVDEHSDLRELLAPPVTKLLNAVRDPLSGRLLRIFCRWLHRRPFDGMTLDLARAYIGS